MADAQHIQADDTSFNASFADYFLDPPQNLQPVDVQNIQDPYLNNYMYHGAQNEPLSYAQLQPPNLSAQSASGRHRNVTEEDVNDTASAAFHAKTYKQTNWSVTVFKGTKNLH